MKSYAERVKEIELQDLKADVEQVEEQADKSSTSTSWYAMLWFYCVSNALALKDMLSQIPAFIFPDKQNPADGDILSWLGITGWPAEILKALGPIALYYQWKNAIKDIKAIGAAKNKNFHVYKKAFVSFITTAGWTLLTVAIYFKATGFLIEVGSYIITGIFALNAANGLINFIYNIGCAITSPNSEMRKAYLVLAAKSLIGIVTATLAFFVAMALQIKVSDALDRINDNVFEAIADIGKAFVSGTSLLTTLTISAIAGVAAATEKFNAKTWEMITSPIQTLKKIGNELLSNPLKIIPMTVNFALRVTALVTMGPLHLLKKGIVELFKRATKKENPPQDDYVELDGNDPVIDSQSLRERMDRKIVALNKDLGKHKDVEIDNSTFKTLSSLNQRRVAKKVFLNRLANNEPIAVIEEDMKRLKLNPYSSFWKKGEVLEIAEEHTKLKRKLAAAPASRVNSIRNK